MGATSLEVFAIELHNPNHDGIMQKVMELNDFRTYLDGELGLRVVDAEWLGAADLPLFLSKAAAYRLCACDGVSFIAAVIERDSSLPDLKRINSQVSLRSGLPVVLIAQIDARQRKALVSQRIPFVVPGRQAYLPMLGFAMSAKSDEAPLSKVMAPSTQAALVSLIANPELRTSRELISTTRMSSSSISRALADLTRRGLIRKSKEGREVIIHRTVSRNELIKTSAECLRNPVEQIVYARKDDGTQALPLAGESALSRRSMLTAPKIEQRAATKPALMQLTLSEVQRGELPDDETAEVQVWSYNPLAAGKAEIDDVSLALTLIEDGDERIISQLNSLFGEELWQ